MKTIADLDEMMDLIEKYKENGHLFISYTEAYPAGFTLGDEDSPGGTTLKIKMQLLLDTINHTYYFVQDVEDETTYKENLEKIEGIKKSIKFDIVEPDELEDRLD